MSKNNLNTLEYFEMYNTDWKSYYDYSVEITGYYYGLQLKNKKKNIYKILLEITEKLYNVNIPITTQFSQLFY